MRLIVSEKNIAARRLAEILALGAPRAETVYSTPVYRFRRGGEEWVSIGLKGHIMKVDFPVESDGVDLKKWRLDSLPALVGAPVLKEGAEKGIIQSLKNLAKKADAVVIATDYDREGELIGADARDVIHSVNPLVPISRVRFSAITPAEIERAFAEADEVSEPLAEAGATRQDIDLIWGAVLTRYLTLASTVAAKRAWGDVLSAGRVQTPALKLVVDRERARDAFVSEAFWVVKARFEHGGEEFVALYATERIAAEAEARSVVGRAEGATTGVVRSVAKERRSLKPPAPFNTTALQAAAAAEGLSPSRTMRIAESLYMAGLISYPRVDNTVYPPSLDIKGILKSLGGVPAYRDHVRHLLSRGALTATRGAKEATDHPPIHPTGAADPERLKPEEFKLYNLIARRFLATFSDAAVLESTKVEIDVAGTPFIARGDVVVTPGFRSIYPYGLKKEERLPALVEGDAPRLLGVQMEEKHTQPPARYSQGRMIQEMEKAGLGTKATRHDIIQTLYDRKYVTGDPMVPTCKGITVVTALEAHAERITSPGMTAELEAEMDKIARSEATKVEVVNHSRELLAGVMNVLLERVNEVGERLKDAADEDAKVGTCVASGHDLLIRYSPKSRAYFVGCAGYPECSVTYPLPKNARFAAIEEPCAVCGFTQVRVAQFRKQPWSLCLSPECPTKSGPEIVVGTCPSDGADLKVRYSATGSRFIRCVNYDSKEHAVSYPLPRTGDIEPTGEVCEPCGAPKVIVHTRKGPWKICVDPTCENRNRQVARPKRAPKRRSPRTV